MKLTLRMTVGGLLMTALAAPVALRAAGKAGEPQVIEVHSKKFAYEPAEITLTEGVTYRLHLTSDDVPHTLRIKALGLNAPMKAGEFDDVLFMPTQAGDFKADCGLYCGVGHTKMFMTVHVTAK